MKKLKGQAFVIDDEDVKVVGTVSPAHAMASLEEYCKGLVSINHSTSLVDPAKEQVVSSILKFDAVWDGFVKKIKNHIGKELEDLGVTAAKGALVTISQYNYANPRYLIDDTVEERFTQSKKSANLEAIEIYYRENGELPTGVTENKKTVVTKVMARKNEDDIV